MISFATTRAVTAALALGIVLSGCSFGGDEADNDIVTRGGGICGLPSVVGISLPERASPIDGCGIEKPVQISSVGGVALSPAAVMDCGTATAMRNWVRDGVKPAVGRTGGGVASLRVAADYACRTRNSRKGAKISEHGKGRAIDISALTLRSGEQIDVLSGWRSRDRGELLRALHSAACGPFGTVLGPESDRYHQDHFHFDTARYRSGSYCR